MNDSEIVDLFLSRDESAITFASQKYGAQLRSVAYRIVSDASYAEECENDAYMSAWGLIPPNEPRRYLFAFLARIVRNKALDRVRGENAARRSAAVCELTEEMRECIPAPGGTEKELEARELSRAVNAFLKRQPREKCDMFLRRYWFFDSVSDIAKRFGRTESSVKTTLWRMRCALKEHLESEGYTL